VEVREAVLLAHESLWTEIYLSHSKVSVKPHKMGLKSMFLLFVLSFSFFVFYA
jgi:hypothetical protein